MATDCRPVSKVLWFTVFRDCSVGPLGVLVFAPRVGTKLARLANWADVLKEHKKASKILKVTSAPGDIFHFAGFPCGGLEVTLVLVAQRLDFCLWI